MAIYKNREVSILGPNSMANSPETINVAYKDGSHENVAVNAVAFTQAEKDALIKNYPSKFEDVKVASDEDVEAVKSGVTPPSDPSYIESAKAKVQADKQRELAQKNSDAAKAEAEKQAKDESKSAPVSTPTPVTPAQSFTVPNQTPAQ